MKTEYSYFGIITLGKLETPEKVWLGLRVRKLNLKTLSKPENSIQLIFKSDRIVNKQTVKNVLEIPILRNPLLNFFPRDIRNITKVRELNF